MCRANPGARLSRHTTHPSHCSRPANAIVGAFLRQIRAVLWGLFGVRRGADSARDLEGARPGTLIIVAVLIVAAIVIGLVSVARWIGGATAPRVATEPVQRGASRSAAAPAVATRSKGVPDTMSERMRACVVCHAEETRRTADVYSPRIAGKPAGYLFNQLTGFRDGRRTYAPMVHLVQHMPDRYLREIAAYFAELTLPYAAPQTPGVSADVLARGRALAHEGDRARAIPACAECHGDALTGANPSIPGLLALPRDYINAQLGAWRVGRMRAIAPDCMGEIARRLSPDDVTAVSAWLSSQPVPPDAKPVAGLAHPLPMECGSVRSAS
jgi:cytochrome c553